MRHIYCVPSWAESSPETLAITKLLAKVESALSVPFESKVFKEDDVHKEKLMALSVRYRLKLPQTSKSKELRYPHLTICEGEEPVIFYPQIRGTKDGRVEISIRNYLEGLLAGHVKSLVEILPLKAYSIKQLSLLREGYQEMAQQAKTLNKEWEAADADWPE